MVNPSLTTCLLALALPRAPESHTAFRHAPSPYVSARSGRVSLVATDLPVGRFGDLPLPPAIASALADSKIYRPTPIQSVSSMAIHRGGHTLLHSATGSGKTLAYLLPLLARLHVSKPGQLLIIVPSRELALQTAAVIEKTWPHHGTRRAFMLAGTPPPAEVAEQMRLAACPVIVATPRPLLSLVRHLAGTDRLHSRRALAVSGDGLAPLLVRNLRAVVLDEVDALLLDREIALRAAAETRRKSYRELSGGSGDIKAPERFTKPTARAVQALLKAATSSGRGRASGGGAGRGAGRGVGRGVGRGGRGGAAAPPAVQLVACSATASYRLREELCRLFELRHEAQELRVFSEADADPRAGAGGKGGGRGIGGVGVPPAITHWYVPCAHAADKARAVCAALAQLRPRCALLFLSDDAPLRVAVTELQAHGLHAELLHEAMGLESLANGTGSTSGAVLGAEGGYWALRSALRATPPGDRDSDGGGGENGGGGGKNPQGGGGDGGGVELSSASAEATAIATAAQNGCRLLVSTAGSARGLDLDAVDVVMLYNLPDAADQYLHLAGRTGRQGRTGAVVSLLVPDQVPQLGSITRQLRISIRQHPDIALAMEEGAA